MLSGLFHHLAAHSSVESFLLCCVEDLCRAEGWGRQCSQFVVVLKMSSLELSSAGAAPAPTQFPSEGASIVTTGQACSAGAAAQLLIRGKCNLLIRLLESAELASGFLFDLEKMRHC